MYLVSTDPGQCEFTTFWHCDMMYAYFMSHLVGQICLLRRCPDPMTQFKNTVAFFVFLVRKSSVFYCVKDMLLYNILIQTCIYTTNYRSCCIKKRVPQFCVRSVTRC